MLETFLAVWFAMMAVFCGLIVVLIVRDVRKKLEDIKQGGTGWE